jgi:hypothetical protein
VAKVISGCTPPEVRFVLSKGIVEDTVKVVAGFNTHVSCFDSLDNQIYVDSIGFYINNKNVDDKYELYYCRDTANTYKEDLIPFDSTLYDILFAYGIKLIVKRNDVLIDSLTQVFYGEHFFSVDEEYFPQSFRIVSIYPNPFNPLTTIEFELKKSGNVNLSVFNVLGELVEILENKYKSPGKYIITWNAGTNQSGVYFVVLMNDYSVIVKKVILLK